MRNEEVTKRTVVFIEYAANPSQQLTTLRLCILLSVSVNTLYLLLYLLYLLCLLHLLHLPHIIIMILGFAGLIFVIGVHRLEWIDKTIPLAAVYAFAIATCIKVMMPQLPALLGLHGVSTRGPPYVDLIKFAHPSRKGGRCVRHLHHCYFGTFVCRNGKRSSD